MKRTSRVGRMTVWLAAAALPAACSFAGEAVPVGPDEVVKYVLRCQKPGGGFGPIDNDYVHPAWAYPAVGTLKLLGAVVPRPKDVLRESVRTYKRAQGQRSLHEYELARLKALLGEDPGVTRVRPGPEGGFLQAQWTFPANDVVQTFYSVYLLSGGGKDPDRARALCPNTAAFLGARQNPDGSFNNWPGKVELRGWKPKDTAAVEVNVGHVFLTYAAAGALELLGEEVPEKEKCIRWLKACQGPGGGFRRAPDRGVEDVWETWAALRALALLGAKPKDPEACSKFLNSLQNADGGFGDRPGWRSRLRSTYYAVDALDALAGDARKGITAKKVPRPPEPAVAKADGMKIYTGIFKFSRGKSTDDVDFAVKLGLDLIGVHGSGEKLREYAREKDIDIEIVDNRENYYFLTAFDGVAAAGHTNNMAYPPGVLPDVRPRAEAIRGKYDWADFTKRIMPKVKRGKSVGFMAMVNCYWQQDTIRSQPWREKYVGRIPVIVDVDVHTNVSEKFGMHMFWGRALFVAKSNKYDDFLDAFRANRIVTALDHPRLGRAYYGKPEWVKYVKRNEKEWRPRWPKVSK